MKRSNLEVGLRVILKKDTLGLGISEFIGQEFTISRVEREWYTGELTVELEGPALLWCNHRDLKRVKVKPAPSPRPFKVGDKVRVIANPDNLFPVGTIGTVTLDDGTEDDLPFTVATEDDSWYYHERDLELYVGGSAPAQSEIGALFVVTGCTSPTHCFPVGTVVRCAEAPIWRDGGSYRSESKDGTRQYVGHSDLKPLSLADILSCIGDGTVMVGIQEALDK